MPMCVLRVGSEYRQSSERLPQDRVMFVATVFPFVFCIVCGWLQSSPTGGRPKNGSVAADVDAG